MTVNTKQILSLIDLTSLNDTDTTATMDALCQKAVTACGHVAAVCVYPRFVKQMAIALKHFPVSIATVINFPHGTDSLETVLNSIKKSIHDGAQEIDVVFPYTTFLAGNCEETLHFVKACKRACGDAVLLKMILETGALKEKSIITNACEIAIDGGCDFLKTSTGKIAVGATLEAAEVILLAIKKSNRLLGFKASGGIRTIEEAQQYIALATQIMGGNWVSPSTFRLGTSSLLEAITLCG